MADTKKRKISSTAIYEEKRDLFKIYCAENKIDMIEALDKILKSAIKKPIKK